MKHYDSNLELQAIKTICDSSQRMLFLSRLNEEYFGHDPAIEIFRRIYNLLAAGKPVPSSEVLKTDTALSEVSKNYISAKGGILTNEGDIELVFNQLSKYRKARIMLQGITQSIESLKTEDPDVDEVVSDLEALLQKCHTGGNKSEMTHFCADNADAIMKEINADLMAVKDEVIPTGFAEFDKRVGGFRRKNVIAMASVPGGGKSAMAWQMAMNQYMMGYNVCYVSYEMDAVEMRDRALSNIARIDHSDINLKQLTPKKIETINKKFKDFIMCGKTNRLTLWCPERELNIPEIALEIKAYNYDIIYIDYLQLLKPYPNKQLWESLGDHARAAKLGANNLNSALVVLCQYDDKEQKLKYSKAITANSHFVWAWDNSAKEQESGIVEIKQLKARNAPTFPFYLQRDFKTMSFRDCAAPPPPSKDAGDAKPPSEIPRMPDLSSD